MTKFAIEAFRNAVWYGCGLALHPPLLPKPAAFLHPRNLVAASPRCVPQRPLRATDTVWLALVLLFVVAALPRCVPQRPLRATDTVWLALVLLFVVAALPRCDLLFNLFGVSVSGQASHSVLLENFEDLVDDGLRLPLTDTD